MCGKRPLRLELKSQKDNLLVIMGNPVVQFQILSKTPDKTAEFYSTLFGWTVSANNAMGYRQIDAGCAT